MASLFGDFVPDIDRVKHTLDLAEPDRVPNFEVGLADNVVEAVLGEPVKRGLAGQLQYRTRLGYDYLYIAPPHREPPQYSPTRPTARTAEGIDRSWSDEHASVITDWDSFRAYTYPEPGTLDVTELRDAVAIAKTLPGHVGVGALMPVAPFTETHLLMGFDRFCVMLHDDLELCRAVIDRIGAVGVGAMKQLCREGVDFVLFGDDMAYTGGMMISPDMMRELCFGWYRQYIAIARDAGTYILFHSDGNIEPVIPDFIDAGLHGLNPIEPLAMDIVELKRRYGGRIALVGNVDVDLLARGTPDQVDAQVRQRIEALAPGGGYMVASSNSVCDYVKPENYRAMLQAVHAYGRY